MDVLIGLEVELKAEETKHQLNLLACETTEQAAAEVVWHFEREYWIRDKYEHHHREIQTHGIVIKDGMNLEV